MSENGKFTMLTLWVRGWGLSGRQKAEKRENEFKGIRKKMFLLIYSEFLKTFISQKSEGKKLESFNVEAREIIIKDWEYLRKSFKFFMTRVA